MSEKSIQSEIIKMLNRLPETYVVKYNATPYSINGVPDLLICHKGKFITMEVKRPGENPTLAQQNQMEKIRSAGGIAVVVRSCDEAREVMENVASHR